MKTQTVHNVKIRSEYFFDVQSGLKPFEVRKNDRNYKVGDTLVLEEWDTEKQQYTGRNCITTINYILDSIGLQQGFVVLGIKVNDLTGHQYVDFRIIQLPTQQVLLTKDFDQDDEGTPLLTITFFYEGVKVNQKLGYENEEMRDKMFNDLTEENAKTIINKTLSVFRA